MKTLAGRTTPFSHEQDAQKAGVVVYSGQYTETGPGVFVVKNGTSGLTTLLLDVSEDMEEEIQFLTHWQSRIEDCVRFTVLHDGERVSSVMAPCAGCHRQVFINDDEVWSNGAGYPFCETCYSWYDSPSPRKIEVSGNPIVGRRVGTLVENDYHLATLYKMLPRVNPSDRDVLCLMASPEGKLRSLWLVIDDSSERQLQLINGYSSSEEIVILFDDEKNFRGIGTHCRNCWRRIIFSPEELQQEPCSTYLLCSECAERKEEP